MANLFKLSSLRGKITSAYALLVSGSIIVGIIAFMDLLVVGHQLAESEIIFDLRNTVLEMRREEKNLFLYADPDAFSLVNENAIKSQFILKQQSQLLASILGKDTVIHLQNNLHRYHTLLQDWPGFSAQKIKLLEEQLHKLGQTISSTTESFSELDKNILKSSVQQSQWLLILSLSLLILTIFIIGHQLKRAVLNPLRQLEASLVPIARGHFKHLEPPSSESEFVTFTNAFNRMLKELEIRQKRMLQTDKLASLGILASGVAHELNNPLSNISTSCQLLIEEIEEAEPEQLNKWLSQIDSETERGRKIVRTLLDFGSQRIFDKQSHKLIDILRDTLTLVDKSLTQHSANLTFNVPDDLSLQVDKQRIQQLFINLIQNATQASDMAITIRISAASCAPGTSMFPEDAEVTGNLKCMSGDEGQVVEILVTDDGPGIPAERLASVFDPFYTSSEPGQGVGLGLYIVQEIVREHDGCLAITSQPGKGVRIIILLPLEESAHD